MANGIPYQDLAKITKAHYLYDKYNGKELEDQLAMELPENYIVHNGLSDRGVLVTEKGNNRVISVKGSNIYSPGDLWADTLLAAGLHRSNSQFLDRKKKIKDIMRNDPTRDYYLTGHSLGGSIITQALVSSPSIRRNTKKATVFNPGSTPAFEAALKPRKGVDDELKDKLEIHRHKNDLVSKSAGDTVGQVFLHGNGRKGYLEAHTLGNFTR